MKKSKVILAVVLAVVLLVTVVNVPTFSWFTRPYQLDQNNRPTERGEKMMLDNKTYTAYNGYDVTALTKSSATGYLEPSDSYTTTCTAQTDFSGSGIAVHNRKYFRTTLTNNNTTKDQVVSLFARKLSIPTSTSNGTLAIGVNEPSRSYRDYTELATPYTETDNNVMRIYFEKNNSVDDWKGTEFYICWTEGNSLNATGSDGHYYKLSWVNNNDFKNHYYVDIPTNAKLAFFCVENWGTNNNNGPKYSQRTATINLASINQTQSQCQLIKIISGTTGGNQNYQVYAHTGTCINHYYSFRSLAMGNTYSAVLNSNWYIGTNRYCEYYSSDDSVFTVNQTTGDITPIATGEAYLYTKVFNSDTGCFWDSMQVETKIRITAQGYYEFHDVPIVKNVTVPADSSVDVYWYVINNSTTNALSYLIDTVYVGV